MISEKIVDLLCAAILDGSDLNIPNSKGEYPIEVACRLDNRSLFNMMIKYGADPSHSSVDVHSYLCKYTGSCKHGEMFILEKYTLKPLIHMIEHGVDIHKTCRCCVRHLKHKSEAYRLKHNVYCECYDVYESCYDSYCDSLRKECMGCSSDDGTLSLTPRLFGYHVKRVRVVSSFLDLYGVCNDVGLLIRSFGGECVECIGK